MATSSHKVLSDDTSRTYTSIDGIFPHTQAAREIGQAVGWCKEAIDRLTEQMLEAITSKPPRLLTRNRFTGLHNKEPDQFWHLVHPDDVNSWLDDQGLDYRWVDPNVKVPVTGVAAEVAVGTVEVITEVPLVNPIIPPHPWSLHDSRDPNPAQPWYTPARHFARQLVKDDSTLLLKRSTLATKVSQSLTRVGINKRGGTKPLNSSTILKALSNVTLS